MIYIDNGTTYWSSHFKGESGIPYFASIMAYDDSSSICNVCYISNEGFPKVVYCSKVNEVPSAKLLKHHIESFLGYSVNAVERNISKI